MCFLLKCVLGGATISPLKASMTDSIAIMQYHVHTVTRNIHALMS